MKNIDYETVEGFGEEWARFTQNELDEKELQEHFEKYFKVFNWDKLPINAVGFDLGCGSGRWAKQVAPRVGKLNCIDASNKALEVARTNLAESDNCIFYHASVDAIPLEDNSMDFGYSLGVLHHMPNTSAGIQSCVSKLKPGAPFLIYIYYAFDNKPLWFKAIWKGSDFIRRAVSQMPFPMRAAVCRVIASAVYFPIARTSLVLEKVGFNVMNFPLSFYRDTSFYTMKTDALDRFGTKLEKRFTKKQIIEMMTRAGLEKIEVSSGTPYWCVIGYKKNDLNQNGTI
ncbi:MAG: SAM-dependent methyltransferase [SAR324 cluster bacterium]|uniref:SAM-dependent methyltransferase n=1 Tax=SAR324 cluster bacterium TaxID=2024889 RepID=A0A2A4T8A8_9DELT|nr:MAG: SAM-dependent methyltransferase [SAR324 cluster bacterium]